MRKNRKQRRAEIKTLPQAKAKRVLTEEERKDHEYRLRQKLTKQDMKEYFMFALWCIVFELLFLPLTIYFIPDNYLIKDDDIVRIAVRPTNVDLRKKGNSVRSAEKIFIKSDDSEYELVAAGTMLMNLAGMPSETVVTYLMNSDTIELWVIEGEKNVVALKISTVSWSMEEFNEELLKDCKIGLSVCIPIQTFVLLLCLIVTWTTFSNKRFK